MTLVRMQLWPGTPEKPSCAFHLNLMGLLEKLFVHCKVSLKEFSEILKIRLPSLQPNLVSLL